MCFPHVRPPRGELALPSRNRRGRMASDARRPRCDSSAGKIVSTGRSYLDLHQAACRFAAVGHRLGLVAAHRPRVVAFSGFRQEPGWAAGALDFDAALQGSPSTERRPVSDRPASVPPAAFNGRSSRRRLDTKLGQGSWLVDVDISPRLSAGAPTIAIMTDSKTNELRRSRCLG